METVTEYGKIRNYDKYINISSINLLHEKYPKRPQVQLPSLYPANVQVVTGDATFTYTAVNTTVPSTTEISGSKTWNDANNQDGIRPTSITINLLADGVQVDSTSSETLPLCRRYYLF